MTKAEVTEEDLAQSKAEKMARERLARNGRNDANSQAGVRVGSDLHLCEMLLAELDEARQLIADTRAATALEIAEWMELDYDSPNYDAEAPTGSAAFHYGDSDECFYLLKNAAGHIRSHYGLEKETEG